MRKQLILFLSIVLLMVFGPITKTSANSTEFNDLMNRVGDFEVDSIGNGLADGWTTTSSVRHTYLSYERDNVFNGVSAQRLEFTGGSVKHQGTYIDLSNTGNKGDIYYYHYQTRARSGYCKSSTSQRLRIYDVNTYNNAETYSDAPISTSKQVKSGTFSTTKTSMRVSLTIQDDSGIKDGCQVYYDGVYIFNLTEIFGSGKEPTKEQMDVFISNYSQKNAKVTNLITSSYGDFEVENYVDVDGLGIGWTTTSSVRETFLSSASDNVFSGSYAQRLEFTGGSVKHQGTYIDLSNAGNKGDIYYYHYQTRARSGYCKSSTSQRLRIYDVNTYNNAETYSDAPISTSKQVKSGTFSTTKTSMRVSLTIQDDSGIKDGCQVYYDGVYIFNLTRIFGSGKEPTKDQMDVVSSQYEYFGNVFYSEPLIYSNDWMKFKIQAVGFKDIGDINEIIFQVDYDWKMKPFWLLDDIFRVTVSGGNIVGDSQDINRVGYQQSKGSDGICKLVTNQDYLSVNYAGGKSIQMIVDMNFYNNESSCHEVNGIFNSRDVDDYRSGYMQFTYLTSNQGGGFNVHVSYGHKKAGIGVLSKSSRFGSAGLLLDYDEV